MSKREKLLWCVYAGILVLLFLMSSTDLIIKERKVEILPISVIIGDASDEYYVNFKKGMEKAAEEFHGDVSFITLYRANDQIQQMDLVQREMRDGAKAVILAPVNQEQTIDGLNAMNPSCPVILLGQPVTSEGVAGVLSLDSYGMGELVARAVADQSPRDVPVYLFTEGLSYGSNGEAYRGVRSVLDSRGFTVHVVEKKSDDAYGQAIKEAGATGGGRITVIALDVKSLDEAAQLLDGDGGDRSHVAGLYGIGSTTSILGGLEKGAINGLAAYNQFDLGYLSVKRAVEAIRGSRHRQQLLLHGVYIDRGNMGDKKYEKMFYPIE